MTEKQKIFADEYLIDLNATRAYRKAYPSVKKDETAAQAGSRMLRNVKVAEYIQERMQERQKRTEITQDRVLQELAACFHRFYTACRIRGEEPQVAAARLKLADDTRMVLKNGLKLIGVDAPEKM